MTEGASLGAAAQSLLSSSSAGAGQDAGGVTAASPGQSGGADARFAAAMDHAQSQARTQAAAPLATAQAVEAPNAAMKGVFDKLSNLDGQAKNLADEAQAAQASGQEMTPGEMVQLSMRAHEFMFNAQLTSNMANRTSDGLQQLFRQQS